MQRLVLLALAVLAVSVSASVEFQLNGNIADPAMLSSAVNSVSDAILADPSADPLKKAEMLEDIASQLRGAAQAKLSSQSGVNAMLPEGVSSLLQTSDMLNAITIPYHSSEDDNKYGECAVGVKLAPAYCKRTTFLGLTTCSSSADCACSDCETGAGAITPTYTVSYENNRKVAYAWRPYCHTRGINTCVCALVALFQNRNGREYYNLSTEQCYTFYDSQKKAQGHSIPWTGEVWKYAFGSDTREKVRLQQD